MLRLLETLEDTEPEISFKILVSSFRPGLHIFNVILHEVLPEVRMGWDLCNVWIKVGIPKPTGTLKPMYQC
jgi:hypothetical protein